MNINISSLQALFSGEGLDKIQKTLQLDGAESQEFADTLMEEIRQLTGLEDAGSSAVNSPINNVGTKGTLHGVAGFSDIIGNGLPVTHKLAKDIDLENTLKTLANVMNTLENVSLADVSLEEIDLDTKLDALLEKVEALKAEMIEKTELSDKLDNIANELQNMKELFSEKENTLSEETDLKSRIAVFAAEINTINETFSDRRASKSNDKNGSFDEALAVDVEENVDLQIANQIVGLVGTQNEPLQKEKIALAGTFQDNKAEVKKESIAIKQLAEEKSLVLSAKTESESLLQQENGFRKPGQEPPVIVSKQNENTDLLNLNEFDLSNDKALPKFATDIANLNRAVLIENKADIPAMTKHFAHPEWNKEIGERIIWMHKQAIPTAELRLNPAHLGPITIKVDVTQDQATVAFTAQHAAVKEAIEAALPKLREMFSAQQLNLAEVNISQGDTGQRQSRGFSQMGSEAGQGEHKDSRDMANNEKTDNAMEIADEIEAGRAIASNGILSIFA